MANTYTPNPNTNLAYSRPPTPLTRHHTYKHAIKPSVIISKTSFLFLCFFSWKNSIGNSIIRSRSCFSVIGKIKQLFYSANQLFLKMCHLWTFSGIKYFTFAYLSRKKNQNRMFHPLIKKTDAFACAWIGVVRLGVFVTKLKGRTVANIPQFNPMVSRYTSPPNFFRVRWSPLFREPSWTPKTQRDNQMKHYGMVRTILTYTVFHTSRVTLEKWKLILFLPSG